MANQSDVSPRSSSQANVTGAMVPDTLQASWIIERYRPRRWSGAASAESAAVTGPPVSSPSV